MIDEYKGMCVMCAQTRVILIMDPNNILSARLLLLKSHVSVLPSGTLGNDTVDLTLYVTVWMIQKLRTEAKTFLWTVTLHRV